MIDPYWKDLVDEQVPGVLAYLLLTGRPLAIDELAGRLWSLVEASFDLDDLDDKEYARHRDHLAEDVRHICAVLAELGAVTVAGVENCHDHPRHRASTGRAGAAHPARDRGGSATWPLVDHAPSSASSTDGHILDTADLRTGTDPGVVQAMASPYDPAVPIRKRGIMPRR